MNAEGKEQLKVYIKCVDGPAVAREFNLSLPTGSDRTSLISPRKKKRKKQIGIKHSQEGISHGCQPARQVDGEQ
jgi:hypothetical protein